MKRINDLVVLGVCTSYSHTEAIYRRHRTVSATASLIVDRDFTAKRIKKEVCVVQTRGFY